MQGYNIGSRSPTHHHHHRGVGGGLNHQHSSSTLRPPLIPSLRLGGTPTIIPPVNNVAAPITLRPIQMQFPSLDNLTLTTNNIDIEIPLPLCLPCENDNNDTMRHLSTCTSSSSSGGGNNGDGNRGPGGSGGSPTPQNLRDNPERLAKVKTEMCHFYEESGVGACPYGDSCNYAHGKHELKHRYTSVILMERSGQIVDAKRHLALPCPTWVATGACPFGRRCGSIHDPYISGPADCPSWLPAATGNTNAQILIDRLAAHRVSVIFQTNFLIPHSIWENCRHEGSSNSEWMDTYYLVCNYRIHSFLGRHVPSIRPIEKISHLQKLCMVHRIRSSEQESSQLYRDYVFAPTHSIQSELCMILQTCYFYLPRIQYTSVSQVPAEAVVRQISLHEYRERTTPWSSAYFHAEQGNFVTVHEVAFAPKGQHDSNLSFWFNTPAIKLAIKLEASQIKRSRRLKQKKKAQIRNEHTHPNANGALISRTCSADFPNGDPDISPFVFMLPVEDNADILKLILDIIKHCIDSLIQAHCPSLDEEQTKNLSVRMQYLAATFERMDMFYKTWTWPKRNGMEKVTISTKAPPGNVMPYLVKSNNSPCVNIWNSFVNNMNTDFENLPVKDGSMMRLGIFRSLANGRGIPAYVGGSEAHLPLILSTPTANASDGTWEEIVLGIPENGRWETALRLHDKKREGSFEYTTARNMPLSTNPFVQP